MMAECNPRRAKVCHAVVAVFLQFFSWGLITAPMIRVLNTTFQVSIIVINIVYNPLTMILPRARP